MARKYLIAAAAAGLLVVVAALLLGRKEPSRVEQQADAGADRATPFISRATTQSVRALSSGDLRLTPGDQAFVIIYDKITGDPKYRFRSERWEPITDNEFHLTRPDVRIHMPDGQTTYIRAAEGQVVLNQTGRNSIEPKRGWLKGDVRVTIDRTTKKWRAEHPDEAELEQHPDQTINIFLGDVTFDLDRARLETNGQIRVQSVESDIDGKGLVLAWNQPDNRIEYLTIREGKKMELRKGGSMVDFAMPGTTRNARPSRDKSAKPAAGADVAKARPYEPPPADPNAKQAAEELRAIAAAGIADPAAGTGSALDLLRERGEQANVRTQNDPSSAEAQRLVATAEQVMTEARSATDPSAAPTAPTTTSPDQKPRRRVDTYSAVFTGDVVVEQRQGMRRPGRMKCDKLEVIFDFGQKQKRTAALNSPARRKDESTTQPAREQAPQPQQPEDDTRLILTWSGPLEMRPMAVPPVQQSGERFDCIATGEKVEIDDGRGSASCHQVVYRNQQQQVWLAGTDDDPVVLNSIDEPPPNANSEGPPRVPAKGRLVGRELFFDRRRGLARVDGPGEMGRSGPSRPGAPANPAAALAADGSLRWTRGMEIEIKQKIERRTNPETGQVQDVARDYISKAWFHGKARIERGPELIQGEEVGATFAEPKAPGASMGPMAHLDAWGHVRLERKPDLIKASTLEVDFETSPDGRDSTPKSAIARGGVLAQQGKRRISGERVAVSMKRIETPAPPSPTPTTRPAKPKVDVAINEIHAFGNVRGSDPDQKFRVRGEELHALIPNGRDFQAATVVGPSPDVFAMVAFEDYQLSGYKIETDMTRQTADVAGPGTAYFTSDRDFGGGELGRSEKTKVTWSKFMRVRGRENIAAFEGDVRSATKTHTLDCDKLLVHMADVKVPPRPPEPQPSIATHLERLRHRKPWPFARGFDTLALLGMDYGRDAWMSVGRGLGFAPASAPAAAPKPNAGPALTFGASTDGRQKQPVRVIASGHASALRTVRHKASNRLLSRAQIRGNELSVDLRRQSMNVPGKGSLLIEDYNFGRGGSAGAKSSLFGGGEGPSQTAFLWANGMSYFVDQALVSFDRQVVMRHASGQQVVLKDDLAAAMKVDPGAMKLPPGRRADLTCDNLLVQFLRNNTQQAETMDVRGADLRQLVASGAVYLQDGGKSLQGERLTYSRETNLVTVEGTPDIEARIFDQDESSQRFNMWRGPLLVWDRNGNRVEAPRSQFISRGK